MSKNIVLNNGVEIPQLGFGIAKVAAEVAQTTIETALELGFRHIDTSANFHNQAVGAAMAASGLPREDIFLTTKLRNGEQGYDSTLRAFDASCERLQVDVVDLYMIHFPSPERGLYVETWKALEKLLEEGRARAIGVSNFLQEHLEKLIAESNVVPAVNQVEIHPTFRQPETVDYSRANGIAIEAYMPLGGGKDLEADAVVSAARSLDRTPAQVVIRWHLQKGHIAIPSASSEARMRENLAAWDFELDEDQIAAIDAMDTPERMGPDPRTFEFSMLPA